MLVCLAVGNPASLYNYSKPQEEIGEYCMDQRTVKLLRQAAVHIKEGRQKAARTILVELLRDNPEIDQAWYMLSFSVPMIDRQISALEEALRVNPNNEKALARLMKLQKSEKHQAEEAYSESGYQAPVERKPAKSAARPQEGEGAISGDDLLSQRLLGEDKSEEPSAVVKPAAAEPIIGEAVPAGTQQAEGIVEEDAPDDSSKKGGKKVFGLRRGVFILVILIAIFVSLGILGYRDQIKGLIAGFQGGGSDNQGEVASGDEDDASGGAVSTPEPTPTEGIDLPPVWTPTPTIQVTPTSVPEEAWADFSSKLINFDRLLPPDTATREEFDEIKAQLSAIMDDVDLPASDGYVVSEVEMLEVLTEFAHLFEYRDASQQTGLLLAALGLSSSADNTDSLMQNMWADPNGTLMFADTGNVLVTDFDSSVYQKYSYAQAVVQNYRNELNPYGDLGIYPMCSVIDQGCEVTFAIAKGEAAFFAEMWANEYFGETAAEEFVDEPVNWYTVSAGAEPPQFMEASLSLPHIYGKDLVDEIYDLGRLEALDDLYADLPTTTEQLMHLEKYLAHEEAVEIEFVDVAEGLGVSWQRVFDGSLGEWKTYSLMALGADLDGQLSEDQSRVAAAGWGGDHAQVYYRLSTQDFVVVVEWAWDTNTDEIEFTNAFTTHLRNQSGANTLAVLEGTTCFERDGKVDCIFSNGENVVWIQAPDAPTITLILEELGFGT
jgi:hypothetical protein